MSDEKSYGDIGFHEYYFGSDLKKTVSAQKWNEVAAKIIAEYKRRQPALVGSEINYACRKASATAPVYSVQWCNIVAETLNDKRGFKGAGMEAPIAHLPSVEDIAKAYFKGIGGDWRYLEEKHQNVHLVGAQAVLDLLQAKQTIGVDMAAPGADKTVMVQRSFPKEEVYDTRTRSAMALWSIVNNPANWNGNDVVVRYPACKGKNCGCTDGISHSKECIAEYAAATKMQDEPEEKHVETEAQYQSRLLRALRSFG